MASRTFGTSLRAASKAKVPFQSFPRRSFVSALAARPALTTLAKAALTPSIRQQTRGVKTIDFAGHKETVYGERSEFSFQLIEG
jgi:ketol-acid reductoisomerase